MLNTQSILDQGVKQFAEQIAKPSICNTSTAFNQPFTKYNLSEGSCLCCLSAA